MKRKRDEEPKPKTVTRPRFWFTYRAAIQFDEKTRHRRGEIRPASDNDDRARRAVLHALIDSLPVGVIKNDVSIALTINDLTPLWTRREGN